LKTGRIIKVSGPLVVAEGMENANVYDVVRVSEKKLIGEIIEMRGDQASIQVYEETSGIGPGEEVFTTGEPLSVELGPGLIEAMFDGIQRPLKEYQEIAGDFLEKGIEVKPLNREKKWEFEPVLSIGATVETGDVLGTVQETSVVNHKIMVPAGIKGTLKTIKSGSYTVVDTIAVIETEKGEVEVQMMQKWPVRRGRKYKQKLNPEAPLITGQRVIDTFFPVTKGGTACVPGPFGSGKTVVQHQMAKWADAEIIVYVGCGERGHEKGYPAYLGSRAAEFYERAGKVICLGQDGREGALTVIGAVSPPGGDISEPVSQATLRIVKVFWGLDANLAYRRHFPAINWLNSYSLYQGKVDNWMDQNVGPKFSKNRARAISLLQEENSLQEIVRLVGKDTLSEKDQLKLEIAKSIREDYLQQNAFMESDTYTSLEKQDKMLDLVLKFYDEGLRGLENGAYLSEIIAMPVRERIARAKYLPEAELGKIDEIAKELEKEIDELVNKGGVANA